MSMMRRGFTIVELLVVIVVIGILAGISIVSYSGLQERAAISSADSAVSQVSKKLEAYFIAEDSYPDQLSDIEISDENGIVYDYAVNGQDYCLSATVRGVSRSVFSTSSAPVSGNCQLALVKWEYSGSGITYNKSNNTLVSSTSQSGGASSPKVANDGAASARLTAEVYATQPSVTKNPLSSNYYGSAYFGADKVTPVNNSAGYTGNGHAACSIPLNQWTTCSWTVATGPNVKWVQFIIRSSPTNYTSDNQYRNIQITINK